MYCCPDCKTPLAGLKCLSCSVEYATAGGIPLFLPNGAEFQNARRIAAEYDSIYRGNARVWRPLGRESKEFVDYFSSLIARLECRRLLEIGCGEGFLLAALNAEEKFAADISVEAIKAARARTQAQCSVAVAERLPYAAGYFDGVVSVGVMEHFLDPRQALSEIRRVLRGGGHYINLVHVRVTRWERLVARALKLVRRHPEPLSLLRWPATKSGAGKARKEPAAAKQPIQNRYTTRGARTELERSGLRVIETIHTRKHPGAPLKGPFVVIYICQK